MKKLNNPTATNGTSFHDVTIITTPNILIKLAKSLNADFEEYNTGEDKCNYTFDFQTKEGEPFSVYDWKEYRELEGDERITFHIGAHNKGVSLKALGELRNTIEMLRKLTETLKQ